MPRLGLRLAVAGVAAAPLALAVLVAGARRCEPGMRGRRRDSRGGSWLATAYGPPWDDGNGSGITATGLNLTAGPPLLEVAVDPSVIALGSYVYVQPNPFDTTDAFYAGDTGSSDPRPPRRHLRLARPRQPTGVGHTHRHRHPGAQQRCRQPARRSPRHRRPTSGDSAAACAERDARPDRWRDGDDRAGRQRARPSRRADGGEARDRRRQPDPHHPLPHHPTSTTGRYRSRGRRMTARAPPRSSSTRPAFWARPPRPRPGLRATGCPGPGVGSRSTPTAPTSGSSSPASRSTPPSTAARRSPRAAGRAGAPTRPPTSKTAPPTSSDTPRAYEPHARPRHSRCSRWHSPAAPARHA